MRTLSEVDITNRLKKWWHLIFTFRVSFLHHSFTELLVKFANLKSCALWTNCRVYILSQTGKQGAKTGLMQLYNYGQWERHQV